MNHKNFLHCVVSTPIDMCHLKISLTYTHNTKAKDLTLKA